MKDAVHLDVIIEYFEIEPPLLRAKAEEHLVVSLDSSKPIILQVFKVLLPDLEFVK